MIIEYSLHIFLSIMQTSIVHLYLKTFFKEKKSSKTIEDLSYTLYFILRLIIKLCIGIPMLIAFYNFFGVLLLSYNYFSTFKKRIFYVSFIYLIFTITNGVAALLVPTYNPSILTVTIQYSFYGSLISKFMNLLILLIFIMINRTRNKAGLKIAILGTMIFIPLSTLFVLIIIYESNNISIVLKLISIILALVLNFNIFYIFNNIGTYFENEWQTRELKQQTIFYENELNLIQKNFDNMRILRHDIQNHLSVVFGLVRQDKNEECIKYLENINSLLSNDKVIAQSGNVVIDSIINFKLFDLERNNTRINVCLQVPSDINIPSFDLATIVGNLIDNAIEGAMTINENRFIILNIIQNKGMLSFRVQNSFDGIIKKQNGKILSRKRGFTSIGTGMDRISKTIESYDGLLEYYNEGNVFHVNVLIYIP